MPVFRPERHGLLPSDLVDERLILRIPGGLSSAPDLSVLSHSDRRSLVPTKMAPSYSAAELSSLSLFKFSLGQSRFG